jgi:hypothetical protein
MRTVRDLALRLCACLVLMSAISASSATAAVRYDPRLRFRVLRTSHFSIYYHQGEERLARRLAIIAEDVRTDLSNRLTLDAPIHTHVVLVDQTDVSNGWATPVPYNLIEIAAVPPAPASFLGHQDDWLRTVFAHEYTHILHLDRVGGWMRGVRWLLGRHPASFPNLFVPAWQTEGIATWAESAVTSLGRVNAADVAAVVASAGTPRGGVPIDRAGGGLIAWPSGHTPYFLGGYFYEDLARRTQSGALGDLARATARRVPFFGNGAFGGVFGDSADVLWRAAFVRQDTGQAQPTAAIRRLTNDGFAVTGPRAVRVPSASDAAAESVYYTSQGPHRFPDIRKTTPGATGSTRVATRYLGDALSSDGRWLYFDQIEYAGSVAQYADLYALSLETGRTHRLSHGQRLTDPDVDRTGTRLAAVRARLGHKEVVLWRMVRAADEPPELLPTPERVVGTPGCEFATPRWSPDGRRVVAVRQCSGSLPAIVLIGADDGAVHLVSSEPTERAVTPAWMPDGRSVVFASDRQDRRFKLYRVDVARAGSAATPVPVLMLDTPGGVLWPDVSADGRTVTFTSMTGAGYDVFAAILPDLPPVPADSPPSGPGTRPPTVASEDPVGMPSSDGSGSRGEPADGRYSPWRTLVPRAWTPVVTLDQSRVDIGASVGATDVLGYHAYALSISWRVSAPTTDFAFSRPPVNWQAAYAYDRWRASAFVSVSDVVDVIGVRDAATGLVRSTEEQTREVFAGVLVPRRRVRVSQSWLVGADLNERRFPDASGLPDRRRNAVRAGWALNSAHVFGYSISPEEGARTVAALEQVSPALGADGRATSVTVDLRAYLPGLREHHVLACRGAAGVSSGDAAVRRAFSLGETGLPAAGFRFGQRTLGLLRGIGTDTMVGSAVAVANLDYRFPLLRVERGISTWPMFLRTLHGAVFTDIGAAGPTLDGLPAPALSIGAEIASDLTLGYSWGLTLVAGAAWTHEPGRTGRPDGAAVFVRTGYAF